MTTDWIGALGLAGAVGFRTARLLCCPVEDDLPLSKDGGEWGSAGAIVLDRIVPALPLSEVMAPMRAILCEGLVIFSCCDRKVSFSRRRRSPSIPAISSFMLTLVKLTEASHLHTSSVVHDRTLAIVATFPPPITCRTSCLSYFLNKPCQFGIASRRNAEIQYVQYYANYICYVNL